mmetsp:Transcript_107563/g.195653  ORF Transcript_107563/g.195653 Transcript_107563/m.195653 type:complete len:207 (+) Transcript_107563:60-680(+)
MGSGASVGNEPHHEEEHSLQTMIIDTEAPSLSRITNGLQEQMPEQCAICLNNFKGDDPSASQIEAQKHGVVFSCGHAAMLHLSCLQKEALQKRPFHCPICRAKFGFNAWCLCGAKMEKWRSERPPPGYSPWRVRCDHCEAKIPRDQHFYHCPEGKNSSHKNGYDVCCSCAGAFQEPRAEVGHLGQLLAWCKQRGAAKGQETSGCAD